MLASCMGQANMLHAKTALVACLLCLHTKDAHRASLRLHDLTGCASLSGWELLESIVTDVSCRL